MYNEIAQMMKSNMMNKIVTLVLLTIVIPTLVAQPSSDGFYLDGVDDYIIVPNTTNINSTTTNNRTYETYFKVTSTSNRQMIFKEGAGIRAVIAYVENGYLIMGAYNRSDYNPQWQGTYYRKAISANTWYHFALVFDNAQPANASSNPMTASANTALKWYLDGVLQTELSGYQVGAHNSLRIGYKNEGLRFPTCSSWTTSGASEYCFGSIANDGGGDEYYFQGNIWGFRLWNNARSASEINDNKDALITAVGTNGLVAALDGDTLTYLNSGNTPVDVNASNISSITWSATAASGNWNTAANWDGGVVPDASKLESVVIPSSTNHPVLNSHIKVGKIQVDGSASITVNAGATLDVYYDLTNNGTITVENNASLIFRENKAVSGTGDYVVLRDSPDYTNRYFYSFWSTPITETNANIATIFPNVGGYNYYWDASPTDAFWNNDHSNMGVGRGYAFRANHYNVETARFSGTVNNGDITEPVYYTNDPDTGESGYNIIGNPYPSAIDWESFQKDNSDVIEGTLYYWRQTEAPTGDNLATDYIEYNNTGSNPLGAADGNVGTAQGFAIQAKAGGGTVTFKNTHRVVANNTQFFRPSSTGLLTSESKAVTTSHSQTDGRLSLRLSGGGLYATQLIGFIPEGTTAYDDTYDGAFINEGAGIEFYSYISDSKMSIQALPELTNTDVEVPLGYQVLSSGTYTLQIDAEYLSQDFDIILEDRYEGTFTDLRQTGYVFTTSPTEENDRFFLKAQYRNTLGIEDIDTSEVAIATLFKENRLVTITDYRDIKTVTLHDISGKQLLQNEYADNLLTPQLSQGIYLISYTTTHGTVINKKVVKKL
ncbi:T9SS type A sorting domain-containing protein [Kordia sp.]|uniref:T9SS type A sorting domain-containing protein n=1 Tax=Kordia sp. TaxID=1965332 RepID=UPI0025C4CF27|nr:T9SS type A sorting domain-containing protein [Kordia sp.]MCH2194081.1 T9SS type A sorting domain-containing protein [Kordia sp.]